MTSDNTGMMIIISSPSGVGKTTLVKMLAERNNNFKISISYTTRIARKDEVNGKDYYFVDKKKFNELIKKKSFYEHAKVFNNFYGTLREPIIKNLSLGKSILLDIDWQGSEQIKKIELKNKLISIFILPPSIKILRERLANRDIKDKFILKERMSEFKKEVLHWKEYDYVVVNNDLEECYKKIIEIIDHKKKDKELLFDKEKIEKKVLELIN